MKILFISLIEPNPCEPGKGVFNQNLVRALALEHEVSVIAPIPWVNGWRRIWKPQATNHSIEGVELYHPMYYYPPTLLNSSRGLFYWHSIRRTLTNILAKGRPDAVVGYWAHPDGEIAVRAARLAGTRSAVIVGGSDVLVITENTARRRRVGTVLSAADSVLVVSEHLRGKVVELGASPANVHLWRQGVNTDCFFPGDRAAARRMLDLPESERVMLWVGRMIPIKGLDVLLSACSLLRRADFSFRLYLVGEGPQRAALEAMARRLQISQCVTFAGPCPHHRLGDWYRAADLTVLPSRSEGLPNVLRESIACGTPFLASRVGGIPEIAADGIDSLVPSDDAEALANAVVQAFSRATTNRPNSPEPWTSAAKRLVALLRQPAPGLRASHPALLEGANP